MNETTTPDARPHFIQRHFGGWPWCFLFVGIFAACCLTRLLYLGEKAIMHDESLFTYYTYEQMYRDLSYRYQPILHGPMHLILQALVWHLFGVSDYTMRLMVALLGIAAFFWVWSLRPWLGRAGTYLALTFYTLSPGVTNFQRFFREDGVFVFVSLWMVASGAHWWRSRNPRWLASFIFAAVVLFCNKESSLFVFFSFATFVALLVIADLCGWLFAGKDPKLPAEDAFRPVPKFPNPWLCAALVFAFVTLTLTRTFEGIKYDADVVQTLQHDFVLKEVRSIPLAMGWSEPVKADGSAAVGTPGYWRKFYLLLGVGAFAIFALLKLAVDQRLGRREVLPRLWSMTHDARFYAWGAIAGGIAFYVMVFTTFFKYPLGPFEIYRNTWAYWGGQHEWGRIGGPFHMHSVNLLVYELPAVLVVATAWLIGMFRMKWERSTAVAVLLCLVPAAAFHVLLFSGKGWLPMGQGDVAPLTVSYFKTIIKWGALFALALLCFPRLGRFWFPLAMIGFTAYSAHYFATREWDLFLTNKLFSYGEEVRIKGMHMAGREYMENQFNFDGGWNLWYVMTLVFFAAIYSWKEIERGRRFHAFLIWWFVTSLGAASYAREAVPQVGIHAALPLVLLAASYANILIQRGLGGKMQGFLWCVLGVFVLWNVKANVILNFRNADDVREKMVYGHTPKELMYHARFITDYARIASVRHNMVKQQNNKPDTEEWIANYNDPKKQKDVKILVKGEAIWPFRWYLRDLDWTEWKDVNEAINERWPFIILDAGDRSKYPALEQNYTIFRGRARLFWTPETVSMKALANTWKLWIPGHYLDQSPQAYPAWQADKEWELMRDYLIFRKTFDGDGRVPPAISGVPYIFCVRKDLF